MFHFSRMRTQKTRTEKKSGGVPRKGERERETRQTQKHTGVKVSWTLPPPPGEWRFPPATSAPPPPMSIARVVDPGAYCHTHTRAHARTHAHAHTTNTCHTRTHTRARALAREIVVCMDVVVCAYGRGRKEATLVNGQYGPLSWVNAAEVFASTDLPTRADMKKSACQIPHMHSQRYK